MIRLESVHTGGRGGWTALSDITLELRPGTATAVVGEGATTLIGLFNRLIEPAAGRILWDDRPLRQHRRTALRRAVGWWSGAAGLFPELSVLDNIGVVPRALGWDEPVRRTRGFELLEAVGLPRAAAMASPSDLDVAQQVRVTLARALAAGPELVLADDPLADLDPDEAAQVAGIARRLQPDWGDMWLVATSSVEVALVLAERLVVLDEGRILQQGSASEVIETPSTPRVAELIGPHRGARALALQPAASLRPVRVATVRDPRSARRGMPTLVVDQNAQPKSWTRGMVAPDGEVATDPLGQSFVPTTDTLRDALEAVLTSPTGLGVAVGETGRYLGVVSAEAIWAVDAEHREAAAQARADQAFAVREAARRAEAEAAAAAARAAEEAAAAEQASAEESAGPDEGAAGLAEPVEAAEADVPGQSGAESEPGGEAESGTDPDNGFEPDSEAEPGTETEPDSDSEPDSKAESDSDSEPDTEPGTKAEPDAEAEAEPERTADS